MRAVDLPRLVTRLAAALMALPGLTAPAASQTGANPSGSTAGAAMVVGVAQPLSGDLLVVGGARVRLLGIAAPVVGQMCKTRYGRDYDCFKLSADVLANLIGTQEVECRVVTTDRTGQQVGVCRSGGADLGAAMVARGWAFAYRSLELDYARAEAFAQSRRLGMWAGRVEMPWQYQSRQLRDQAKPGP